MSNYGYQLTDLEFKERELLHEKMRENHRLLESVKLLNDFCDKDERQPYYDIKKHRNGSVYLTIRTQNWTQEQYRQHPWSRGSRKSKKFFGKTRYDVTVAAAQYVREGKF